MSKVLELCFAAGDYELVRPLKEGVIKPDGIELIVLTGDSRERHWRMAQNREYDICEFNIFAYLIARDQGLPLSAVPVFLHRRFRHGFIFVNASKAISKPADLIGRRVGTTNYQPAGNMWMRGILEDDFNVPHNSMTWLTERDEDVGFVIPDGLRIERIGREQDLDTMLLSGEIDALISPDIPRPLIAGDPRIRRLFVNYKDVEVDYFQRTGLFPIMHVTVVREEILQRHPWVAANLVKAFNDAKQLAYQRIRNPRVMPLAWFMSAWEEQNAILGSDPWAYGLGETNRRNIETISRYAFRQGVIKKELTISDLFAHTDTDKLRLTGAY